MYVCMYVCMYVVFGMVFDIIIIKGYYEIFIIEFVFILYFFLLWL